MNHFSFLIHRIIFIFFPYKLNGLIVVMSLFISQNTLKYQVFIYFYLHSLDKIHQTYILCSLMPFTSIYTKLHQGFNEITKKISRPNRHGKESCFLYITVPANPRHAPHSTSVKHNAHTRTSSLGRGNENTWPEPLACAACQDAMTKILCRPPLHPSPHE